MYGLYVINDPGNFAHLGSIGGARDRSMSQYLTEQTPSSCQLTVKLDTSGDSSRAYTSNECDLNLALAARWCQTDRSRPVQQVLGRSNDHHRSLHHTPTGASAARRHTRQAPDTYDRTAINRATEPAYVPHMYVYSSRRTQGLRYGSCRGATVGPRTVGRPIPPERASHARVDQRVEADDPSGPLPPAICRALQRLGRLLQHGV